MKNLILKLAKHYILKAVNDLLKRYNGNVTYITTQITVWTTRLQKIIEQLKLINQRVSDGILTNEEIEDSTREIKCLVQDL